MSNAGDPSDRVITRRQLVIALGAGALVAPLASFAQQPGNLPRIGLLWIDEGVYQHEMNAFREGLRALGYVDGRNVRIDDRFLVKRYEELPDAAAKLVREKVSVIVTYGGTAAQAAAKATSSIPVIILTGSDPVRIGVATSLSRPGRNVTGITWVGYETVTKHVQILKEVAPGARRIGALLSAGSSAELLMLRNVEEAARKLNMEVRPVEIRGLDELETVVSAAAGKGVEGFVVIGSILMNAHRKRVVNAISQTRIPAVYQTSEYVEDGGLISYSANVTEGFRRSATYIDKILKGVNPGEIPIEQPTRFELVINLKTAKALGLKIPQTILVRADRVIE